MRLKYQSRVTPYDIKCYGVWEYETKEDCMKAERLCSDTFTCGILSKGEFGDGYTETTYVYNLEKIEKIFEDLGGKRVDNVVVG